MPVPNAMEIAVLISLPDVPPNQQMPMAQALGNAVHDALSQFVPTAMVQPGIPTTAVPPAMAGATAAPGRLEGPVLPQVHYKTLTASRTQRLGLDRGQKDTLDTIMAKGIVQGLNALSGAMMMPGVPVGGGVTTGPGRLMAPTVSALSSILGPQLQSLDPRVWVPPAPAPGQVAVPGRPVVLGPCLPKKPSNAVAKLIGDSMQLFIDRMLVAPGIPVAGGITAGPGMLM